MKTRLLRKIRRAARRAGKKAGAEAAKELDWDRTLDLRGEIASLRKELDRQARDFEILLKVLGKHHDSK